MESTSSVTSKPGPAAAPSQRNHHARSAVTNGRDILPNVDGRSLIARRFYDVVQAILADQAGIEHCSETKIQLIRRFAASAVMAEELEARLARGEDVDIGQHAALSSTLVRLAQRIGIARHAKLIPLTLRDYLQERVADADNNDADADGDDIEGADK